MFYAGGLKSNHESWKVCWNGIATLSLDIPSEIQSSYNKKNPSLEA